MNVRLLLSSPRRRRRLAKIAAGALAVTATVVLCAIFLPTKTTHEHFEAGKVDVPAPPKHVRVTPAMRRGIAATLDRFIWSAVARRNLAASYDLVTEDMKGGISRREWAHGTTSVYPYPVRAHSFVVDYAYPNDVTVDVMMQPTVRMRRKVGPLVMRSELIRRHGRWLIDSFLTQAVFSSESAPRTTIYSNPDYAPPSAPITSADSSRLSVKWLLVPAALLALALLVPLAYLILTWRRNRRVAREIEAGFRARRNGYNGSDAVWRTRGLDAALDRALERMREREDEARPDRQEREGASV